MRRLPSLAKHMHMTLELTHTAHMSDPVIGIMSCTTGHACTTDKMTWLQPHIKALQTYLRSRCLGRRRPRRRYLGRRRFRRRSLRRNDHCYGHRRRSTGRQSLRGISIHHQSFRRQWPRSRYLSRRRLRCRNLP